MGKPIVPSQFGHALATASECIVRPTRER